MNSDCFDIFQMFHQKLFLKLLGAFKNYSVEAFKICLLKTSKNLWQWKLQKMCSSKLLSFSIEAF